MSKTSILLVYGCLGVLLLTGPHLLAQEALPTLTAGTCLRVRFESKVGTAISRAGDGVKVQILKSVEAEGREVLPVGTVLTGRVLEARKGDKHTKTFPMIRLGFTLVTLPSGQSYPAQASLADLGVSEYVDSEGAASTVPTTKAGNVVVPVATSGIGAAIGGVAGGSKGAGEGAAIGAGVGVLLDADAHVAQWYDFELKKGRNAWLRLDADLSVSAATGAETSSPVTKVPGGTLASTPTGTATGAPPMRNGSVYLEPVPKARFYKVDEDALRRDMSKAGISLVEEPSRAGLVLRVWDDSHGFHGELADRERVIEWVGYTRTQGGLVRDLAGYLRDHGLVN